LTPHDYLQSNIDKNIAERRKKLYNAKIMRKKLGTKDGG